MRIMNMLNAQPEEHQGREDEFGQNARTATAQPVTIVMVDDDQDDRDLAAHTFSRSPLVKDLIGVPDGTDFLAFLRERGIYDHVRMRDMPVLILLDLQMPGMSGFEVLKKLRYDEVMLDVPIVVLSSLDSDQRILQAFHLGADGYLTKPLNLERLEAFLPMAWASSEH